MLLVIIMKTNYFFLKILNFVRGLTLSKYHSYVPVVRGIRTFFKKKNEKISKAEGTRNQTFFRGSNLFLRESDLRKKIERESFTIGVYHFTHNFYR